MDQTVDIAPTVNLETGQEGKPKKEDTYAGIDFQKAETSPYRQDEFGDEEHAEVKYKILKWWYGMLNPFS